MNVTVGLKEDGTVVATNVGDVSSWSSIKAVSAGDNHILGLKEDGTVVVAGNNAYGQLDVSSWTGIKAIAAGWGSSIGVKEDGTVVAVGSNEYGKLDASSWTDIKAVAAGEWHTIGLKEDGTVVAVGYSDNGQLDVSSWTDIKAIKAGRFLTVGLKKDGTIVMVGSLNHLYGGADQVLSWTGMKAIEMGGSHAVGLKEDGTVLATGYGYEHGLPWSNITAIAVAMFSTVGLKEDGTVVAVGLNYWGQLNGVDSWSGIRQPACLNNAPLASAGPDQVIECARSSGTSVTLDGSGSTDPDGDPLTYNWIWDGGSIEGVNPTVVLPLGITEITLTVSDGKATATDTVSITVQDTIPPVTTATGGNGGWYNTNVISTFSAIDGCSGVKEIHYTVNGAETVTPGDSASLTLAADGIYSIAYYSIDTAGNIESPKSMTIKIDKTPPTLNLSSNPNILWPPNHKMADVLIGGDATDFTSGIASVTFSVTDEYGIVQPSISNFHTTIQLEAWRKGTDKDGRHYTITAVAADAAGNKTTKTTTVLVPHDQR